MEKHPATEKNALVVDDSKLARYVLKEMLLSHGIRVETAESAEEALGTLSVGKSIPDVIFMDHMMPGMDGFQAVQAIKNDPKTATIPIIMYTSKDDGVYVSQARALGAVGVIPKKLKPVQLEKVLVQLKLVAKKAPAAEPETIEIPEPNAAAAKAGKSSLEEIALSASEELEKDSMRSLFRQLFTEQRDSIKQDQHSLLQKTVDELPEQLKPLLAAADKRARWHRGVAYVVAAVALTAITLPVYEVNQQHSQALQTLNEQLAQQQSTLAELSLKTAAAPAQQNTLPVQQAQVEGFDANALEWALNQNSQIAYQQNLNAPKYMDFVANLVQQLADNDFKGLLMVKYHAGEFCELVASGGERSLPEVTAKLDSCKRFAFDVRNTAQLGIDEFIRYLDVVSLYHNDIDVKFESAGSAFTLVDYPALAFSPSAGEWNRAAALNNRFEYELIVNDPTRQATVNFAPVDNASSARP